MSQASSVACASTSSETSSARSSAPRRKTCGVCTAHRLRRSSVSATTRPSATRLIVSVTGTAAMAASALGSARRASITFRASCGVSSGRAASCTSTSSPSPSPPSSPPPPPSSSPAAASARLTDAERTAPPCTATTPAGAAIPAGSATTMRFTCATLLRASRLYCKSGCPASSTSALGRSARRRSPLPAATIRASVMKGDSRTLPREPPPRERALSRLLGGGAGHLAAGRVR